MLNVLKFRKLFFLSPMHQQSLMLLHPMVKEKMHLQENTLFSSFCILLYLQQILFNINKAICMRLDGMENFLTTLGSRMRDLEVKLDQFIQTSKQQSQISQSNMKKG